jgi:quercetin dioxygenase-like cupin family protein
MAKSGQVIENPRRKARMTFLQTADDTGGELLEMLVEEEPTLARPPLHSHPYQEERFEVKSGTLDYQLGEQAHTVGSGEVAVVPPGVYHTWWNSGSERLVARIELRPALRFETCLETIYGLARAGKVSPSGAPGRLQAAVLLHEFRSEYVPVYGPVPAFLPRPVRSLLIRMLAALGRSLGYRPWYPEFSPFGPVEHCVEVHR